MYKIASKLEWGEIVVLVSKIPVKFGTSLNADTLHFHLFFELQMGN